VLVIPSEGVVGIADTWPIAVTQEHGALHTFAEGASFENYKDGELAQFVPLALSEIVKMELVTSVRRA
jgi:hypothetical protein